MGMEKVTVEKGPEGTQAKGPAEAEQQRHSFLRQDGQGTWSRVEGMAECGK